VVHTGGSRRRGKPRSRILYWFRTPPGVRVGRSALDEEAIRLIEEHNPDVEFDWTRILKGQDETAPSTPAPQRERRAKERPPRESVPPTASRPTLPVAAPPPPSPTAVIDVDEDEDRHGEPDEMPAAQRPPSTRAEGKLGAEGLARLRARHAAVLARISEGITDPARCDELKAQAERLNPDTWVTDEEIAAGIESYEAVFESIRTAVGRRRKRRRPRRPRTDQPAGGAAADGSPDGSDEDAAEDETPDPEAS
jgi:hypothetical protein